MFGEKKEEGRRRRKEGGRSSKTLTTLTWQVGKKLYFTRLKNVNVASGQFVFKTNVIDVAW